MRYHERQKKKDVFKVFDIDYIEIILLTINQLVQYHTGDLPPAHKSPTELFSLPCDLVSHL